MSHAVKPTAFVLAAIVISSTPLAVGLTCKALTTCAVDATAAAAAVDDDDDNSPQTLC